MASRRKTSAKQHFAELRRLREEGKTRLTTYEVEEDEKLYEDVDEDEYKQIVRKRLDEDDFVVDDGGEGYVDNGMDDWGDEGKYYSDEDGEGNEKLSKKELKRKREEEKERRDRQEGAITKYFNKSATAPAKPKTSKATIQDQEFLRDLLGEFDTCVAKTGQPMKKVKTEPAHSRRMRKPSPPRKGAKRFAMADLAAAMRSSPPITADADNESDYGDDITFPLTADDDDISMSDAPVPPSSPAAKAALRKAPENRNDDDDDFAVAEIKGNRNIRTAKVNITSSRPTKPALDSTNTPEKAAQAIDSSAWTDVSGELNVVPSSPAMDKVFIGKTSLPDAVEQDGSIRMFWTDYTEAAGNLILFGKVKDNRTGKYVSAFLKVEGVMRNLFFLPREHRRRKRVDTDEEVKLEDVFQEVSDLMEKNGIPGFKLKPTSRKYAFELPDIPRESDYLKVLYPYTSEYFI